MSGIDEAWVRQRAHEIWVTEGKPEGKDFDHWYAATAEFRARGDKPPAKKRTASKAAAEEAASETVPVLVAGDSAPDATKPAPKKRAPAKKKA